MDKLLGIGNKHYADLTQSRSELMSMEARQDATEFAVIAFWDLDETDVFICNRFFIVPYP